MIEGPVESAALYTRAKGNLRVESAALNKPAPRGTCAVCRVQYVAYALYYVEISDQQWHICKDVLLCLL